jgi:UDP-3-O-[3-hydroxymyristoyl] N-acetylglucosamine deacetylase/3-hydroxyacyl-[acyl-carrier-protein] dehydratase
VQTVEHLLSCLGGLGIDNLEIEIDGPEVPGADGSALPFLELIREAGRVSLGVPRRDICLTGPIHLEEGRSSLFAVPADEGLTISYTFEWWSDHGEIDTASAVFAPQHFTLHLNEETYAKEIAPARTFVANVEAEKLRSQGLGLGADYSNTLVVGPQGVIENQLRFPDEFVRHKILDLVGDLALLGADLRCHIVAIKSGHEINRRLVERVQMQVGPQADQTAEEHRDSARVRPQPAGKRPGQAAGAPASASGAMDVRQISAIMPHRFPFLLVDRVLELEDGKRAVGLKNVTMNEPYFQGHFPGLPIMPGVLQIETRSSCARPSFPVTSSSSKPSPSVSRNAAERSGPRARWTGKSSRKLIFVS